MKILSIAIIIMVSPLYANENAVTPRVASSFGKVFVAEVEFVEKGNTYIEQRVIQQPWLAKVISVDGVKLEKPVVMEYWLSEDNVKKGEIYKFKAYEDFYQLGKPDEWDKEVAQISYHIRHRLMMKPMANSK